MGNLWKVAVAEYARLAHKRSFVLSLIGMPLFIGAVVAIAVVTAMPKGDSRPLGYVDLAGVTHGPAVSGYAANDSPVAIEPFANEEAARGALQSGGIQGYYLIPADYLASRQVTLYTWGKTPAPSVRDAFTSFLTAHLAAQAPADAQKVLVDGIQLNYRAANDAHEMAQESFIVSTILPFVIGFFFVIVVMSSGGYLLQAVTTEKESRMVEVMMTSVSPFQLIGGKALGLIGVALTQISVWLAALAVGLIWGSTQVSWLREIQVPVATIVLAALWFLPTYVLLAGLMITVGSMVTELQHAQQIAGAFNLFFALPFFFMVLIFTNPDSPVMTVLTLFPTTSMMTIAMRLGVTSIPAWQLILSYLLVVAAALASIRVAARVFRLGMLRYGQPLSLAGLLELLRSGRKAAVVTETGRIAR